jgi:hypothetical protein
MSNKPFKRKFQNLTNGNEKIDNLIQEMQLKINFYDDIIFEWISYGQFSDIKKIDESGVYLVAIWKDGPLYYNFSKKNYTRSQQNKNVCLKQIYNSQDIINEVGKFYGIFFLTYNINFCYV